MRRFALLGLALCLTLPAASVRAEGIDLGTVVGAGLGGLVGNQIGKGTGNTVATVAGVIIGGVAGHSVDRDWNSPPRYRSNTVVYEQPTQPVNYYYRPNYVAPPAPPTEVVYYQERYEHYPHWRRHWHDDDDWQRPVSQTRVVYTQPAPVALRDDGYCREYTNRVAVGGRIQESYGRACQQPDGAWRIVE